MITFPEAHSTNVSLKDSLVPKYWRYNDILIHDPASLEAKVFFCYSARCKVSCHAPICCNEECRSYGAKKV